MTWKYKPYYTIVKRDGTARRITNIKGVEAVNVYKDNNGMYVTAEAWVAEMLQVPLGVLGPQPDNHHGYHAISGQAVQAVDYSNFSIAMQETRMHDRWFDEFLREKPQPLTSTMFDNQVPEKKFDDPLKDGEKWLQYRRTDTPSETSEAISLPSIAPGESSVIGRRSAGRADRSRTRKR